ncbi:hypothetical protein F4824DRAFT_469367 [Ustulina deusta]|nr:hypothetical protein F4824DRAFT_469367 [Ustulina deusta]
MPAKADLFFQRLVLHHWTDKNSVRILRPLIPSLENWLGVIIMDACKCKGPSICILS